MSTPAPPSTDSSVSAPTPSFAVSESSPPRPLTWKRSVDASSVNGLEVRPLELDAPGVRLEAEHVASRRRAVDFGAVVAGVAVQGVRAVAVVPHECVVAGAAVEHVGARGSDDAVVALAAVERVVALGAGEDVVTRAAVEPDGRDLVVVREHRERIVAVAAVDDDGERAVGGHRLVTVGRAVPVRLAVEAAGRLIVHEQAAPDTDTITLSSAPSRLSVAVRSLIDAELTAACAGTAVAARLAASATASAANVVVRFTSSPLDRVMLFMSVALTAPGLGRRGAPRTVGWLSCRHLECSVARASCAASARSCAARYPA